MPSQLILLYNILSFLFPNAGKRPPRRCAPRPEKRFSMEYPGRFSRYCRSPRFPTNRQALPHVPAGRCITIEGQSAIRRGKSPRRDIIESLFSFHVLSVPYVKKIHICYKCSLQELLTDTAHIWRRFHAIKALYLRKNKKSRAMASFLSP